ncbi:hypothetical protein niasHT_036574 [Heterodera trifolii]|uniref:Uncharacterized protein n=1 Tax=Heterodera trifolii TaxID=157864 RepID=A0ABD2I2M7_9BILA
MRGKGHDRLKEAEEVGMAMGRRPTDVAHVRPCGTPRAKPFVGLKASGIGPPIRPIKEQRTAPNWADYAKMPWQPPRGKGKERNEWHTAQSQRRTLAVVPRHSDELSFRRSPSPPPPTQLSLRFLLCAMLLSVALAKKRTQSMRMGEGGGNRMMRLSRGVPFH